MERHSVFVQQPGAWAVTAAGALALMAGLGFGRFSYTMLLPSTRDGLGMTYTAAGLLGTANLIGYLAGSLVSGSITARIGPRATGVVSVLGLVGGLAWMSAAHGSVDATLARALAGVAGGVIYVQALGLAAAWFPGRAKGLASGVMHAGNGAGLVVTGLGLPMLIEAGAQGWRTAWGALALAALAVLPLTWMCFRYPEADASIRARAPQPTAASPAAPAGGPSLVVYAGLYGLFGLAYIIYVTFFAAMLRSQDLPLVQTGMVWAIVGALSLMSGPVWGALSDRLGRLEAIAVVFLLQVVAYLAFLHPGFPTLVLSVAVFGVTAWGIPAIMAAAMGDLGRVERTMVAFGRITTVMGMGQAAGPFLAGALADATASVNSGLWISAGASIAGCLWSFGAVGAYPALVAVKTRRSKA
jgi:predicted MFS family arabinose efflux permease